MTEIQRTNIDVANFIIEQLGRIKPFSLKLDAGQTGALYHIATESRHLHTSVVKMLVVTTWQRVRNGTGIILEINESNEDAIYHMLSSYIEEQLPESVVESLKEVS